ncbi:ABC transporter permease [Pseudoxanthomonas putridarboris]|uniref:ABC transporter permease n=1 Tax=Pseudoxanthomonas putridarboris TaxID=752605 RepID=A0ABU9J2I6_9GAMM
MSVFLAAVRDTLRTLFAERYAVVTMIGAVILYSVFYPSAYRHQVASNLPVVVVDDDHSPLSRDLVRRVQGVRAVHLRAQVPTMDEAHRMIAAGQVEGVLWIPAGLQRDILRGGTGHVAIQGNGAYLSRASTVLAGLGDAVAGFAPEAARKQAMFAGAPAHAPYRLVARPLFNTREGYGSAIVPGVAELIVHQTLLIGIAVILGGRRRDTGSRVRMGAAQLAGMGTAFFCVGLFGLFLYSGITSWVQDYPRGGNLPGLLLVGSLFLAATVLFAMFLGSFFVSRERAFQYITASSLVLFFLANLSWPITSTPPVLAWAAKLLPTTPGITAMVQLNQMGASVSETAPQAVNLLALVVIYAGLAMWRFRSRA